MRWWRTPRYRLRHVHLREDGDLTVLEDVQLGRIRFEGPLVGGALRSRTNGVLLAAGLDEVLTPQHREREVAARRDLAVEEQVEDVVLVETGVGTDRVTTGRGTSGDVTRVGGARRTGNHGDGRNAGDQDTKKGTTRRAHVPPGTIERYET